ncbi:tyrosine-type recombinase/integrase [Pseudoflavonifractor sp.]|jgi:site-specific recombinase XerD|uniref:tyrosine-type recombinase/integrase n=1 Tax=Pseudoflavonifractor sp. TaxID=1980281 RepID=UPI003D912B1B
MDYRIEAPAIIRDFLSYHETIQGHSRKTVDEYFLDLRNFFRYLKIERDYVPRSTDLDQITIDDLDIDLVRSVKLSDVYSYMNYLSRDRAKHANSPDTGYGLTPAARARKIAAIRSFYKYITSKAKLMDENPMQDLDSPRLKKALPHYLSLDESIQLLESVDGENKERDYCILILFLNCGLRISELVGLNLTDIRNEQLRVLGKGNKERILFLNEACQQAIEDWLAVRGTQGIIDKNALFITRRHTRMTTDAVHYMIKKRLTAAGLDASMYSAHKLRHTAATLMLQNGVDVRTLQEVLGHDHLNTTQIYTHVDSDDLRTAAKANPLGHIRRKKKSPSPLSDTNNGGITGDES